VELEHPNYNPSSYLSYFGPKGDGELGAKTLWLELRDIAMCVEGMLFARELL
jgi:hypothetical protein